MVAIFSLTYGA